MIRIPRQKLRPIHYEGMERQLKAIFKLIVFDPVLEVIAAATAQRVNAREDALRSALQSGRVQYSDGTFSGEFQAAIGRYLRSLGATFDARAKIYRLAPSKVPSWISAEAGLYSVRARAAHTQIKKTLGYIQASLDQAIDRHTVKAGDTVDQISGSFREVAKALRLSPTLSDESRDLLRQDYTDNMKLWIRNWSEEMIADLRGVVDTNAVQGYRFDKLIDAIQNRYSVSTSKAKFLARQETALFMSKFRQFRFKEAGVTRYRWLTSNDERVRETHRELNGTVHSYDSPPYVAPGRKANPGEDYNCRCVDEPILVEAA